MPLWPQIESHKGTRDSRSIPRRLHGGIWYTYAMSLNSVVIGLLSGILPSLIWLWFWTREDRAHPEPKPLIAATFFGGMFAIAASGWAEQYVAGLYDDPIVRYTIWAAIEEVFKFLVVAVIALYSKANDEPIDAMVYCIVGALGFAALENGLFVMDLIHNGEIAAAIATGNLRFIGATLLHIVSSALVGFMIGLTFYRGMLMRVSATIAGLIGATAIHATFNISIVNSPSDNPFSTFLWIWGAVVILIVLFEEIKLVKPRLW